MGALDNGFRLNPATQPIDGDVFVYDAATDSLRPGGAIPGAIGLTSVAAYTTAGGSIEAGTSLGVGATEINNTVRPTFIAPSSGKALVRLTAWVESPSATGDLYWYPRVVVDSSGSEASKPALKVGTVTTGAAQYKRMTTVERLITGLVAGTTYRIEWQQAATVAGYTVKVDTAAGQQTVCSVVTVS